MKLQSWLVALLTVLAIWPASARADDAEAQPAAIESRAWSLDRLIVDFEIGPLYILQNDGRYGEDGTEYSAGDVAQQENLLIGMRNSVEFPVHPSHTFIFLYAPLDLTTRVTLEDELVFRGTRFAQGTVVDHRYLFDGYRFSYLYGLLARGGLSWDLGASLQVRNANVGFTSVDGEQYVNERDIGMVFALKTRLHWVTPSGPWAMLDFDGLSTFGLAGDTTGGIYDGALTLGLPVLEGLDLIFRARGIGGGADVPNRDIYNWAHFLAFTSGVRIDLAKIL